MSSTTDAGSPRPEPVHRRRGPLPPPAALVGAAVLALAATHADAAPPYSVTAVATLPGGGRFPGAFPASYAGRLYFATNYSATVNFTTAPTRLMAFDPVSGSVAPVAAAATLQGPRFMTVCAAK